MANARQVARWIVNNIAADLRDEGTGGAWMYVPSQETLLRWLDSAEEYVKKYSGDDTRALDHINGDPCDNRPENMRVVTVSENMPVKKSRLNRNV